MIGGNLSPIYLTYNEHKHLTLTNFVPTLVCLKRAPWFGFPLCLFWHSVIEVNATSPNVYPLRAFTGTSASDLQTRSPWLQEFSSVTSLLSVFNSPTLEPGNFELLEDTTIDFVGLDSHCIAFISPSGSNFHNRPAGIDVKFDYGLDWSRIFRFLTGLGLFLTAPILSNNLIFYYASGMGLSVIGSAIILLLIAMRLLPKRTSFLLQGALLIGGGALSFFLLYLEYLRSLLWDLLSKNILWVLCYALGTVVISGAILYWFSLPERLIKSVPRTQILIQFIIRIIGVFLIATAPHLPSQLPILTDFLISLANLAKNWLNIDSSVVSIISPLLLRTLFVGVVLFLYHFTTSLRKKERESIIHNLSWENYQLPDLPCATSSPYVKQNTKPLWHPPGSAFHDVPLTTNYGGYGYFADDVSCAYVNGSTESYWDGNGYVFSPVGSKVRSKGLTPRREMPSKRRSQVGWNIIQTAVLTDDEEDEEY